MICPATKATCPAGCDTICRYQQYLERFPESAPFAETENTPETENTANRWWHAGDALLQWALDDPALHRG